MRVRVNGRETDVEVETTIGRIVDSIVPDRSRVAVERNREIVPHTTYDTTPVAEGDVIEIVTLAGGG
jgi:thiamine biosynthesis protein ThiS